MFEKHVTSRLSAYYNGELTAEEARHVAEHLLACARCRQEHEQISLGARLAESLPEVPAPPSLWSEIEELLDARPQPGVREDRRRWLRVLRGRCQKIPLAPSKVPQEN